MQPEGITVHMVSELFIIVADNKKLYIRMSQLKLMTNQ